MSETKVTTYVGPFTVTWVDYVGWDMSVTVDDWVTANHLSAMLRTHPHIDPTTVAMTCLEG